MTSPEAGPVKAVELAYPLEREGVRHECDAVVELPADEATQLVRDGRARWPQEQTTKAGAKARSRKEG